MYQNASVAMAHAHTLDEDCPEYPIIARPSPERALGAYLQETAHAKSVRSRAMLQSAAVGPLLGWASRGEGEGGDEGVSSLETPFCHSVAG